MAKANESQSLLLGCDRCLLGRLLARLPQPLFKLCGICRTLQIAQQSGVLGEN